ncbi:histidine phosphatase family protein [Kribbella deserti]|uniref:Histidine phosphatase family protein n=1 Tax=Kribbella deserti TaxID=1926257 RepID=A0ABV6QJL4_9ACTN
MVLGGDGEPDPSALRPIAQLVAEGKGFEPAVEAWVSPEVAAQRTAEEFGLRARLSPRLRDREYGDWAGRRFEDLLTSETGIQDWITSPEAAPPGGESADDLILRAGSWLDDLAAGPDGPARRTVVAVVHPTVVAALVLHAIDGPPSGFRRLDIRPLAQVRLTARRAHWSVRL